jgi:hypothetical protein
MQVNARIVASDSVCRCRLNRRIDEGEMPKVSFDLRTAVPPERVMAMLTDFSPNRPEIWPMLAPELYEVYRLDAGSASVKEGSTFPRRIWERDDYEWSADRVRWTVRDSNYCQPGSYVEVGVRPEADGGTRLQMDWNRRGVGIKGKMMIAFVVLTRGAIIRRKVFQRAFDREERA